MEKQIKKYPYFSRKISLAFIVGLALISCRQEPQTESLYFTPNASYPENGEDVSIYRQMPYRVVVGGAMEQVYWFHTPEGFRSRPDVVPYYRGYMHTYYNFNDQEGRWRYVRHKFDSLKNLK